MGRYLEIPEFWFGPKSGHGLWFGAHDETDREVRDCFSRDLDDAVAGRLTSWESDPESAVALVVSRKSNYRM